MNSLEHLRIQFDYNDWANRRVLVALKQYGSERTIAIFSHILAAEVEWYERLHGKSTATADFWPVRSLEECGEIARETAERYEKLLRRFDEEGLDMQMRYRNSKGTVYQNTFRETLSHVLLHSATHRGNIILKLREEGGEPPATDHIIYLRETKYI